jgi:hypothetical protein
MSIFRLAVARKDFHAAGRVPVRRSHLPAHASRCLATRIETARSTWRPRCSRPRRKQQVQSYREYGRAPERLRIFSNPRGKAIVTEWVWSFACSLSTMLLMWKFTVVSAICSFLLPSRHRTQAEPTQLYLCRQHARHMGCRRQRIETLSVAAWRGSADRGRIRGGRRTDGQVFCEKEAM